MWRDLPTSQNHAPRSPHLQRAFARETSRRPSPLRACAGPGPTPCPQALLSDALSAPVRPLLCSTRRARLPLTYAQPTQHPPGNDASATSSTISVQHLVIAMTVASLQHSRGLPSTCSEQTWTPPFTEGRIDYTPQVTGGGCLPPQPNPYKTSRRLTAQMPTTSRCDTNGGGLFQCSPTPGSTLEGPSPDQAPQTYPEMRAGLCSEIAPLDARHWRRQFKCARHGPCPRLTTECSRRAPCCASCSTSRDPRASGGTWRLDPGLGATRGPRSRTSR